MAVQQAASCTGRLAYVAVSAAGMAAGAVIPKHLLHGRMLTISTARLQYCPIPFLGGMQAAAVGNRLFFMAFNTYGGVPTTRPGN